MCVSVQSPRSALAGPVDIFIPPGLRRVEAESMAEKFRLAHLKSLASTRKGNAFTNGGKRAGDTDHLND